MAESRASEVLAALLALIEENQGRPPSAKLLAERAGVDVTTARRYLSGRRPGGSRSAPEDTETVWSSTSVVRGGAGQSQFTVNQGQFHEPPGAAQVAGPPDGRQPAEPPRTVTESPPPDPGPDGPPHAPEFAPGQPVTTETGQRASGPGPGDSIQYVGRTGRVWALLIAIEGDSYRVRSGQYGRQMTVAASRVVAWERGAAKFHSLGGNSASNLRGPR